MILVYCIHTRILFLGFGVMHALSGVCVGYRGLSGCHHSKGVLRQGGILVKCFPQGDGHVERIYLAKLWYIDRMSSPVTQQNAFPRGRISPATVPAHLLSNATAASLPHQALRLFSTTSTLRRASSSPKVKGPSRDDGKPPRPAAPTAPDAPTRLTHLTPAGEAHMVPIAHKPSTARTARAVCSVVFSGRAAPDLVRAGTLDKGDVLAAARIAGIMAAKRTPDLVPLCHPVLLSRVGVQLHLAGEDGEAGGEEGGRGGSGRGRGRVDDRQHRIDIAATVTCDGKTGVEMEALTAAAAAALTVYDMCKAVDKGMRVEGLRVVLKEGGKSGRWVEGVKAE